jgi:hypothetical protein
MTKKKGFSRQWIFTGLIVLAAATFFYIGYRQHRQWKKDHILLELKPFQTAKGWGYNIYTDGKVFIHQDIVPALPGNKGFRTREDAMAVGSRVCERLKAGQLPAMTAEEIKAMGIIPQP